MEELKLLEKYNPRNTIQLTDLYKQLLSYYFGINSIIIAGKLREDVPIYYAYYGNDSQNKYSDYNIKYVSLYVFSGYIVGTSTDDAAIFEINDMQRKLKYINIILPTGSHTIPGCFNDDSYYLEGKQVKSSQSLKDVCPVYPLENYIRSKADLRELVDIIYNLIVDPQYTYIIFSGHSSGMVSATFLSIILYSLCLPKKDINIFDVNNLLRTIIFSDKYDKFYAIREQVRDKVCISGSGGYAAMWPTLSEFHVYNEFYKEKYIHLILEGDCFAYINPKKPIIYYKNYGSVMMMQSNNSFKYVNYPELEQKIIIKNGDFVGPCTSTHQFSNYREKFMNYILNKQNLNLIEPLSSQSDAKSFVRIDTHLNEIDLYRAIARIKTASNVKKIIKLFPIDFFVFNETNNILTNYLNDPDIIVIIGVINELLPYVTKIIWTLQYNPLMSYIGARQYKKNIDVHIINHLCNIFNKLYSDTTYIIHLLKFYLALGDEEFDFKVFFILFEKYHMHLDIKSVISESTNQEVKEIYTQILAPAIYHEEDFLIQYLKSGYVNIQRIKLLSSARLKETSDPLNIYLQYNKNTSLEMDIIKFLIETYDPYKNNNILVDCLQKIISLTNTNADIEYSFIMLYIISLIDNCSLINASIGHSLIRDKEIAIIMMIKFNNCNIKFTNAYGLLYDEFKKNTSNMVAHTPFNKISDMLALTPYNNILMKSIMHFSVHINIKILNLMLPIVDGIRWTTDMNPLSLCLSKNITDINIIKSLPPYKDKNIILNYVINPKINLDVLKLLLTDEKLDTVDFIIHLLKRSEVNIFVLCYLLIELDISCTDNIIWSYLSSVLIKPQNDVIALLFIKYKSCNIDNILQSFTHKPFYNHIISMYRNRQLIKDKYTENDNPLLKYLSVNGIKHDINVIKLLMVLIEGINLRISVEAYASTNIINIDIIKLLTQSKVIFRSNPIFLYIKKHSIYDINIINEFLKLSGKINKDVFEYFFKHKPININILNVLLEKMTNKYDCEQSLALSYYIDTNEIFDNNVLKVLLNHHIMHCDNTLEIIDLYNFVGAEVYDQLLHVYNLLIPTPKGGTYSTYERIKYMYLQIKK